MDFASRVANHVDNSINASIYVKTDVDDLRLPTP